MTPCFYGMAMMFLYMNLWGSWIPTTGLNAHRNKDRGLTQHHMAFFTAFSKQLKWVNRILANWKILKGDKVLGPVLPDKPQVVFRKAHTQRNIVALNVIERPLKVRMIENLNGFYPCRRYNIFLNSRTIRTSKFTSRVTSKEYPIKDFNTCQTRVVIYL